MGVVPREHSTGGQQELLGISKRGNSYLRRLFVQGAGVGRWEDKKSVIAARIRQIGVERILWGSDGAFGEGLTPQQALEAFQQLPLSTREFHEIDSNIAPYMR
jgi:hypothetical protein